MGPSTSERRRWRDAGLALAALASALALVAVWLWMPGPPPTEPTAAAPRPSARPTVTDSPAATGGTTPSGGAGRPTGRPGASPGAQPSRCVRPPTMLRVATFNIHSGFAVGHRGLQLAQVAAEVRRSRADVVLLQETDDGRSRTGRVNQPAVLAADTGLRYVFGANVVGPGDARYGTTILTRWPVRESSNTPLPRPARTQQRGLLHAVLDVHGQEVSIYDTHLENTSLPARVAQVRRILPILAADPRPIVLGGDLNSGPRSAVLALARTELRDTWAEVGSGPGFTHPQHGPHVRIDYLLHRDGTGADLRPVRARVRRSAVSDHRMVTATYALSPRTAVCVPVLPLGSLPGATSRPGSRAGSSAGSGAARR